MVRWTIAELELGVPGVFGVEGGLDRAFRCSLYVQTLTVRRGGNARRQAVRLKHSFDSVNLKITLICIPDPGDYERDRWDVRKGCQLV